MEKPEQMYVVVEGVRLELTKRQIQRVLSERRRRQEACNSFVRVLEYWGFTKVDTSDWVNKPAVAYEHKERDWFAEIEDGHTPSVWMVGPGLKSCGFPGGWVYWCPEEVMEACVKATT